MPISFLNPTLLFGALAAALPVIIHFLSRRRVQRQKFSDLRFLSEVQSHQARSLGVRRWLLLLLRVLAILCVALAVASPRWGGLGHGSGERSVLFVIDTSASMGTGQADGTRLEAAVRVCENMIGVLPGDAAVQVMVAGSRTAAIFGDWLPAGAGTVAGLGLVEPSGGAFDLGRVLTEAGRLIARAPGSPVQVVLLSDLQDVPQSELQGQQWSAAADRFLAAGASHILVRRVGEPTAGGGVLAVDMPQRAVRPGENITLGARVIPQFNEQVFVLELDDRPVAEVVTSGHAGEELDIGFALTVPGTGVHLGRVHKDTDALPDDDSRAFVLDVPRTISVLVVHGSEQPRAGAAGRGGWRYLAQALAPGGETSAFATQAVPGHELTTGAIQGADVVFFVDPDPLGRRVLEGLLTWVREGGQVVLMAGDPQLSAYLSNTLLPALGLPPELGFTAVGGAGQRSKIVDPDHPVFEGLENGAWETFEEVTWRRWFGLQEGAGSVLVSLTGDDPLVVEIPVAAGRAVVMAANLHPSNNGLAVSPMALPFLQRLTSWLAGSGAAANNTLVGAVATLNPRGPGVQAILDQAESLLVVDPTGESAGAAELVWEQGKPQVRGAIIDHPGFVTFLAGPDTLGVVAAGLPAAESFLNLLTTAQFGAGLADAGLSLAADLTDDDPTAFLATLGGHDLTPWLLSLALLLLLLEMGVGRGVRA